MNLDNIQNKTVVKVKAENWVDTEVSFTQFEDGSIFYNDQLYFFKPDDAILDPDDQELNEGKYGLAHLHIWHLERVDSVVDKKYTPIATISKWDHENFFDAIEYGNDEIERQGKTMQEAAVKILAMIGA